MTRTALYVRFSSARQVGGASLPDQLARLRADCAAAGETVAGEYVDQARSGTSAARRPAYQQLLADAREGKFARVRVESVDRGHRNDTERRQFEAELTALRISVIYAGEAELQAPEFRKFNRGIKGVVAELESDVASQRTYKRHLHRAKQGKWRGGSYPYGMEPNGHGWMRPEAETYNTLIWILERRAEGLGYHSIARRLNEGLGDPPKVPPTPGALLYAKKPYIERQDPETGDVTYIPKAAPTAHWKPLMIRRICEMAVDGPYAGVYQWGRKFNRFGEDAEGQGKAPVRVEQHPPLVLPELLDRVRAVEHAAATGVPQTMAAHNAFLLDLHCQCGQSMHGYTSTKIKYIKAKGGERKEFKYRKYRCMGRANRPGSCKMPMLSADELEQAVVTAIFTRGYLPAELRGRVAAAIDAARTQLLDALDLLTGRLAEELERRAAALDSLTDRSLSGAVRQAMIQHAEQIVASCEKLEGEQRTLRAGVGALDAQARSIDALLNDPNLDPARWREPSVYQALKRLFTHLIHSAELHTCANGGFVVDLRVYRVLSPQGRENGTNESTLELFSTTPLYPRRVGAWQ